MGGAVRGEGGPRKRSLEPRGGRGERRGQRRQLQMEQGVGGWGGAARSVGRQARRQSSEQI